MRGRIRVVLAVSALVIGCKGSEQRSEPGQTSSPASSNPQVTAASATPAAPPAANPDEPAREAARQVDIKTLLKEYGDNEVRADGAFKGKLVQVTGLVGDVKRDITGGIYVTVGTGGMLEIPVVQCAIAEGEAGAASALSKGQQVTVRGRVSGLMMNVQISDCEINPLAKLCKKMQAALGGKECRTNEKTGDAPTLVVRKDGKSGVAVLIECVGPSGDMITSEVYDFMTKNQKLDEHEILVESRAAGCFANVWAKDAEGKATPVPDDIKARAQAFFDTL
ncbi:OB-fold protein [Sorangium sp. So ce124]|uniref:OB-fold protein n=1 Tax=Sorangium sp. So ce124 TaxID=3133280 RepID=UPI003F605A78